MKIPSFKSPRFFLSIGLAIIAIVVTTFFMPNERKTAAVSTHISQLYIPGAGCVPTSGGYWNTIPNSITMNNGLAADGTPGSHYIACPFSMTYDAFVTTITPHYILFSITMPANSSWTCLLDAIDVNGSIIASNIKSGNVTNAGTIAISWQMDEPLQSTNLKNSPPLHLSS